MPDTIKHTGTLIVAGNGMVGYRFCRTFVDRGGHKRYNVIVFGEEPRPAYDRVHLTEFFSGRSADDLTLAPKEWYQEHGIELRLGDPVVSIARDRQIVTSKSGEEFFYNRLILATGSSPVVPPMEGKDLPGVFLYRTVEDLDRILACSRKAKRAAVIGGGLLGLEAARALQALGLDVHVIEARFALMSRQLDPDGSKTLQENLERLGLKIHVGRQTKRVEEVGSERVVHFLEGGSVTVDMVVVSVGIRARDELAAACDLPRGPMGGVVVDDRLQTSDPRIYAIGECACHRGTIYGFAAPGYQMADALAANFTDGHAVFQGGAVPTQLKLMGVEVATAGDPLGTGAGGQMSGVVQAPAQGAPPVKDTTTSLAWRDNGTYRKLVVDGRRVVGAIAVGHWREFWRLRTAIAEAQPLSQKEQERFRKTGVIWPGHASAPVSEWPESDNVCVCMEVTRGALGCAIAQGCATVAALAKRTGASTMCGSCKPLLAELVGAPPAPARGRRGLLTASMAACALIAAILLAGPLRGADSVQRRSMEFLWRDGFWKQVSGFTLLGLSVAGLVLSLRKRWKKFSAGDVGIWRFVHGLVGAVTLAVLVAHTGLRLGANLNFALMTAFLALAFTGSAAGGVLATAGPAITTSAGVRYFVIGTHVLLFFVLPALLAFHILSAYYF